MMRLGLIADTHIPYRARAISPAALEALRGADLILHAGDVDEPAALMPLRALAPVYAVRGNFHVLDGSSGGAMLPETVRLEVEGFRIAVTHGHFRGLGAWIWKFRDMGRQLARQWTFPAYDLEIVRRLLARFPDAEVIVYGHTHRFDVRKVGHTWLINPGAALQGAYFGAPVSPSVAWLELSRGQAPQILRIALPDRG